MAYVSEIFNEFKQIAHKQDAYYFASLHLISPQASHNMFWVGLTPRDPDTRDRDTSQSE